MNTGIKSGMELDWDGIWADVETAGIRGRMASTSIGWEMVCSIMS